jgi:hypothetical protein
MAAGIGAASRAYTGRPVRLWLRGAVVPLLVVQSLPPTAGPDGFTWHLFFDVSTHRLTGLSWMAKPVVTMTAHTTMAMSGGRAMSAGPPPVLPSNPTEGMADVVWQMTIGDYRVADGLTWPHRFTTTVNGRKAEDLKLGSYKINPSLDAGLFKLAK